MISYEPFWEMIKERGLTQYELYTYFDVSRSDLYRLKNNRNVEIHTLNRLCNSLGCEPEDVFRYTRDGESIEQAVTNGQRDRKTVEGAPES